MKNFTGKEKILWQVTLVTEECVGDNWEKESLFFRAINEKEVWRMLCEYAEKVYPKKFNFGTHKIGALRLDNKDSQGVAKYVVKKERGNFQEKDTLHYTSDWHNEFLYWRVEIYKLRVLII